MESSKGCALKRHKVSAFRDFPLGCGTFSSRVDDPYPLGETMDPNLENENVVPLDNLEPAEVAAARSVETADCGQDAAKKGFAIGKRVSAVRDFPHLCGPNASSPLSKAECAKGVSSLENRCVDDKTLLERVRAIDAEEAEKNDQDGLAWIPDIDRGDSEGNFGAIPEERSRHRVEMNLETLHKGNGDAAQFAGTFGREIVVYQEVTKPLDTSNCGRELKGGSGGLRVPSRGRAVVLGLMANSKWFWKKGKEVAFHSPNPSGKPSKKNKGKQLVAREQKDSLHTNVNIDEFQVVKKLQSSNVNGHPNNNDSNVTRNKVRETLRLFQAVSRKLLRKEESRLNEEVNSCRGVDLQAAKILKENGKYLNTGKKILGSVPGVEVGDEFQYRVELNIVGLHHQIQGDIDYVKQNGKILASSVVASTGHADELDNSDVLIYTGLGENTANGDKELEDEKLEQENIALKNSIEEKNPVRVIRGSELIDGKCKTYVYDGQYVVETCWQDTGPHGKPVLRFRLQRIPGQPELASKEVKKSKKFKTREFLRIDDISDGKEPILVGAVNTVDNELVPPFKYVTRMIYPNWCNPLPLEGCDCVNGCSSYSKKCPCVAKNGGAIPFNHDGAIVEAKPLVYECGPSCGCPSTCYNRVSQHGVKFQLEIFKTKSRGWGVRSLNSIPSGSFICEYIGELLGEDEADDKIGNDEYLFDIGNNYNNSSLWDGLSVVMPPEAQSTSCEVVEDSIFTIDAARYGNVGRFINHSCSPNLYAQNVLYDHDDKRIPHIMLFAAENIPPLQELSYDYNYKIDTVFDSDGNVKRKYCYCGSVDCTGRMY